MSDVSVIEECCVPQIEQPVSVEDSALEFIAEDANELSENEIAEEGLQLSLIAKISAVLFVSPRPQTIDTFSKATGATAEEVETALHELACLYQEDLHGFSLVTVGDAYQLRTSPRAAKTIQALIPPRAKRLSRAAAETLAVIAYKQPVQRAEIESIRGVDALPTLKTLIESGLIRVVGRDSAAGQPALYGTTPKFLERFGLKDLSELPTVRELGQLSEDPGENNSENS